MNEFCSRFRDDFDGLLAFRKSVGFDTKKLRYLLLRFDRYCCQRQWDGVLTKEIVHDWISHEEAVSGKNLSHKAEAMKMLGQYLTASQQEAYVLPTRLIPPRPRAELHVLSKDQMKRLFATIDNYPYRTSLHPRIPPVLFRLIYTCGLRPGEGVFLEKDSFDVDQCIIRINQGKGHKDRIVPLSNDMASMLKSYKIWLDKTFPRSKYMFPSLQGGALRLQNVRKILLNSWRDVGGVGRHRLRVYDLRHQFASQVIQNWVNEKKNINQLFPYLRAFMGHENFNETFYYIHLLPKETSLSKGINWTHLNAIIPEVSK